MTPEHFYQDPVAKMAAAFAMQAREDYAGGRCAVLFGHFSGFVLAQQAAEKLLKAYIYLGVNATCIPRTQHRMGDALDLVCRHYPALNAERHRPILLRLQDYFDGKYPDMPSPPALASRSTLAELAQVDTCVIDLFLNLPIPMPVAKGIGIMHFFYHQPHACNSPDFHWIASNNQPFAEAWSRHLASGSPKQTD